jgi:hypothetical protein
LSNNEDAEPEGIRALKYEVFKDYKDPRNRYFYRFDIAIVQLHSNDLEDKLEPLAIEWSYKSWEDPGKEFVRQGILRDPETTPEDTFWKRADQ